MSETYNGTGGNPYNTTGFPPRTAPYDSVPFPPGYGGGSTDPQPQVERSGAVCPICGAGFKNAMGLLSHSRKHKR